MKKNLFLIAISLLSGWTFSQTIVKTGDLITQRSSHQTQNLPNGNVITFGGITHSELYENYKMCNYSEIYNPSTQKWTQSSGMLQPRYNFGSIVLQNGNILVVGGEALVINDDYEELTYLKSCEIYNVSSGLWETTGGLDGKDYNSKLVLLNDGKVLMAQGELISSPKIYDPATGSWNDAGSYNYKRERASLSLLEDGKVLVAGGDYHYSGSGIESNTTAEIYDPATEKWTLIESTLNRGWTGHQSITLSDGRILFYGRNYIDSEYYSEIYNPKTMKFYEAGKSSQILLNSDAVLMKNGDVMVYTELDIFGTGNTKIIHVFNASTNTWSAVNTGQFKGSRNSTLTKLEGSKILVTGGDSPNYNPFEYNNVKSCFLIDEAKLTPIEGNIEINKQSFYPNPSKGELNVNISTPSDLNKYSLSISDLSGKVVFNKPIENPINKLDLSEIPNGIYCISLYNDVELVSKEKLVINH